MRKEYDVFLGYFKQGHDLASCQESNTDAQALKAHAKMLQNAADTLVELSNLAKAGKLSICGADTHMITVECDEKVAKKYLKSGVFSEFELEDDEEDTDVEDGMGYDN